MNVMPFMSIISDMHNPYGKRNCMSRAINIMNVYSSLMTTTSSECMNAKSKVNQKHARVKTPSPLKDRKKTHVPKAKITFVQATKKKQSVKDTNLHVNNKHVIPRSQSKISKPYGPNQVWVPRKH